MKILLLTLLAIIAVSCNAPKSDFLTVGKTYRITYSQEPSNRFFPPAKVKIMEVGEGFWRFVEYEQISTSGSRVVGKGEKIKTEHQHYVRQVWINFAEVLTVKEVTEKELEAAKKKLDEMLKASE